MDYWKSKVLPKIKVVFAKSGGKKAAAAELLKSFDESKEGINGEFEEKKADLQPKVVEIYEAAPAPVKVLIKERKVSGIKKNSAAVTKFVEDLANIEFPGAKQVNEGIAKVGPALLSGPIFATFEKVSTLLPAAEEAPKEAPAAAEKAATKEAAGEEKKEEAGEKQEEAPAAAAGDSAPAAAEPAAEESAAPAEAAAEAAAPVEPEPAKAEEEAPKA
uniref:Plasma membrane-associated cation-binding protein 1 n=1 Tax=Sarocalamus faberi TaxID=548140 RepID=A0A2H4LJ67_SARFB|nr:plasma membrane-associated cation-binding protein 1 [Sarocalamus faberi]